MSFHRVRADDDAAVAHLVELYNATREVDDPQSEPAFAAGVRGDLEYGWDLEPDERYLYVADGSDEPVGAFSIDLPIHDNLNLVWCSISVHPRHRRAGHGTAMMAEILRRAREAGRTTVWIGGVENDAGSRAFAESQGFHYASHDARRRQALADVDWPSVDALYASGVGKAEGYRLERHLPPYSDELLTDLVDVTAAINDAPMGDLTFEDEHFDLARLRKGETARSKRGWRVYRIAAREIVSGEIGGHTFVVVDPDREGLAFQADTAVARAHRGHRLGLLLKIDMMRWLADVEPQLKKIETWNNADNTFMISVNESIGYRLSNTFAMYERRLTD